MPDFEQNNKETKKKVMKSTSKLWSNRSRYKAKANRQNEKRIIVLCQKEIGIKKENNSSKEKRNASAARSNQVKKRRKTCAEDIRK